MVINQNLGPVQTERMLGTTVEEGKSPQVTENDYYPEEHDLDNLRELDEDELEYISELQAEKDRK